MNILLINHYAGSPHYGMEYRPYYLAREWCRQGHQVSVVAASHSHVRTRTPRVKGSIAEEPIDGIRYVWLRTPSYHGNGLRRVLNMFAFVSKLRWSGRKVVGRNAPDVVIASSTYPLDSLPARRLALRFNAPLIYEVHDLWPLSPMELGRMPRWHPFIVVMQWAENYAARRADAIVSLLPKAEPHFRRLGMREGRFFYLPNGIDVEEWGRKRLPIPEEHRSALRKLRESRAFLIGYTGAHGLANALDSVLEAARLLEDQPIAFALVGQGPEKESLKQRAARAGLKNLIFLPPVPKPAVPSLLEEFDALYLGLQRQPLFRFGISPNKLMDYMMAGKPILQAIDAGNDPVAESDCGISLPPEDAGALADAAVRMLRWTPTERTTAGLRGREHVLRNHDYRVLARRFLEVINTAKPTDAARLYAGGASGRAKVEPQWNSLI